MSVIVSASVLLGPTCIALGEIGLVFTNTLWRAPIRQIIALTGEYVERLDRHAVDCAGVLVPTFSAVNLKAGAPGTVHLSPGLICAHNVMALHDEHCIWIVFQLCKSPFWITTKALRPFLVDAIVWAIIQKICIQIRTRKIAPNALSVGEVKEVHSLNSFSLGKTWAPHKKEANDGWKN